MTSKNKKQFGVWMDSHQATVIGREESEEAGFIVLGHVKNNDGQGNSSEKNANNSEKTLQHKFYKEILSMMQNAEHIHVTGTGTEQEQFIHYLGDTPQFKNTSAKETTSNKMSDEKLVEFISGHFN